MSSSDSLRDAAKELSEAVDALSFGPPTAFVYNPWITRGQSTKQYLKLAGKGKKKVVFLGMNPGPFGMAQTGVPFGEISAVRDWMGLSGEVGKPSPEHPKRQVEGLACAKSEVSGRRLWGLFSERFGKAESFFEDHFVANYCPLVFMEEGGRNRTPDKLPASESKLLEEVCDAHLLQVAEILRPDCLVGVGSLLAKGGNRLGRNGYWDWPYFAPQPASPTRIADGPKTATEQMLEQEFGNRKSGTSQELHLLFSKYFNILISLFKVLKTMDLR